MTATTELYPSAHIAELFFPLASDENAVLQVIHEIAGIGYYRGFETGIIHRPVQAERQTALRGINGGRQQGIAWRAA